MNKKIITGIDIGTHTTKVVVSEITENDSVKILGIGTSTTSGLHNGYIVNLKDAVQSVIKALDNVVKNARIRPTQAYLSIGGISVAGIIARGSAYIRHSDAIITEKDFEDALRDASEKAEDTLINKKILHDIPLKTKIDNELALADPIGMRGSKLENTVMLIHALEKHIDDFISAVEDAGVEVIDVTAGSLAAGFASLSNPQRMQGCILLDIGAESTDVLIYENNTPIALNVLPIGSNTITNDIAINLKISTHEAEKIKRGETISTHYEKKTIEKIISKSMNKLYIEIKKILKGLDDDIMLPSGILITGGGARLHNIDTLTKSALKLPAKTVYPNERSVYGNPELTVAYGLCIWGAQSMKEENAFSTIISWLKKIGTWLKQLLP